MASGTRDMNIRVRFSGADSGLTRLLDGLAGSSNRAGRAILETRQALKAQKDELRNVQSQLGASSGNVTHLIDSERRLEASIAGANAKLERQTKLLGINRTVGRAREAGREMVANGRAELFGVGLLAAPLFAIAKAGAEVQALQNRMKVLGLGDGAVKDLTAYAQAMNVAGSATKDNMRYLLEAQGAFRETGEHSPQQQLAGAKLMAPILAKMHVVDKSTGKEMSEEEERYMLRFVEQAGGLTDPRRAKELANGVFRARQSSGGNVNFANYQGFLASAGSAGTHLSNKSMFADFEPLIAELHEQAGVGLASAYGRATGITKNGAAAKDFMKLGIWDSNKVVMNKMGGVKEFKGNPLAGKANELLARDPVEFYRQIVLPAYGRAGIKDEEVTRQNSMLFGRTGGKLFNLIDKQSKTIDGSRTSYGKTQGIDQAHATTKDSFDGKLAQLKAAGSEFMVAASLKGGLLDNVTSLMTSATSALTAFTAAGKAHPTAFVWLGWIVTHLLLLRVGLSLARIAFGGLLGPAGQIIGVFMKLRAGAALAEIFPRIAFVFGLVRTAALFLARGVMQAGLMMLANPMVLAVVAIGAALVLAGYLIYRNWDTIKAAFASGLAMIGQAWAGIKSAFNAGVAWLASLLPSFRNIGAMMLEGLLTMLSPARLVAHITALGTKAVTAFKNVLGIHSPSRVFAGLGGHVMTGLTNGLAAGERGPLGRLQTLSRRMTTTVAAGTAALALSAAPAGAATRSSARSAPPRAQGADASNPGRLFGDLIIHSQPGMNERQLADLVARKVAEIMAQAQTRTRSSFADEPDWGSPL